ncbi:hypothetical protein ACFQZC_13760 [Streptacidiphilus monticola]
MLQSSYATSADTFTLTNMHLGLSAGSKPCTQPHD